MQFKDKKFNNNNKIHLHLFICYLKAKCVISVIYISCNQTANQNKFHFQSYVSKQGIFYSLLKKKYLNIKC